MRYEKLVRDNIPEHIVSKGGTPITHIAEDTEYWQKLKEKLSEEVKEFNEAESADELADVLEVIDAIIDYKKFDRSSIEKIKKDKAEDRGKFDKRIILDES
jgi:predicted house-cleaning noncanonical NTP pyrophosphatase (MazG superfamily)